MYCKHFGIDSKPFSITPDPRFLFLSDRHREALAHLVYGVGESGGFVQLTGEVGTGKTTLCRALLEQLPDTVDVALILNPKLTGIELVAAICDELKVDYPRETQSLKVLIDRLNQHLLQSHAAGRRTVAVIDEAQNLSTDVLEQVRLLTNLETAQAKLLQIILIGQPELQTLLAREELRQLAQRITARYHLGELDRAETRNYVIHRLRVAGGHADLFATEAVDEVYRLSGGVPRLINVICDRALLGAYVEDCRRVDRRIVRRAADEVLPEVHAEGRGAARWPWAAAAAVTLLLAAAAGAYKFLTPPSASDINTLSMIEPEAPDVAAADAAAAEASAPAQAQAAPETADAAATALDATARPALAAASAGADAGLTDASAVPEPAAPTLTDRLLAAGDGGEELRAWTGLYKLWGAELYLDDKLQPCAQALREGLRCVERSGNWTQLRKFDRPAILHLIAPDGRRVPLLLRGLDAEDMATVELAGEELRLPLAELDAYWQGAFTLLWRPPMGSEALRVGSRSEDVRWLRERLDRVQPDTAATATVPVPDLFDGALAERVRQFQSRHALDADGVVGAATLLHLDSADSGSGGPRLSAAAS